MTYSSIFIPTVIDIPKRTQIRQRVTSFGDNYLQTSLEGFNPRTDTYPVTTRTMLPCEVDLLEQKLLDTNGQPFYWTNPFCEDKQLVRVFPFSWERNQNGPLKQQLSFTLRVETTP